MTISMLSDILLSNFPFARAEIKGSAAYPNIHGGVDFFGLDKGVIFAADIDGLPVGDDACACKGLGFHIHEGGSCTGTQQDPFADTKGHFNPDNCLHPCHAGDMPPLFGNSGRAWMAFLTDRISVDDIIGKTVVIHSDPDDFVTQPSGKSGVKIACGEIKRLT